MGSDKITHSIVSSYINAATDCIILVCFHNKKVLVFQF